MSNKIRIGVWLGSEPYYSGGAFQYSLLLLKALYEIKRRNPTRYDLVYFSSKEQWKVFIKENFDELICDFVFVNKHFVHKIVSKLLRVSNTGLYLWRVFNRVFPFAYGVVYKAKADIMICPRQDALAYEIKIPTVSTIYDLMHRYESDFPEACDATTFRRREKHYRRMCRFSRVVLVDSQLGKQQVIESYRGVLNAKVVILPYLPPPYILERNPNKDFSYVKEKYALPERYIFYPAQFWKHKNHHNLVKAINYLRQKGFVVNAVFVGSRKNNHEYVSQLIEQFKLHDQIRNLNYVPNEDIVGLYKNSIALVMPTFFGPTNIPIVEAHFLGIPVVCSNVYAMPEQVGEAGLLFDPNNVDDMAEKIYMVWTDESLRKELIKKGRERAKDMTLENYTKKWEEVIEAAL